MGAMNFTPGTPEMDILSDALGYSIARAQLINSPEADIHALHAIKWHTENNPEGISLPADFAANVLTRYQEALVETMPEKKSKMAAHQEAISMVGQLAQEAYLQADDYELAA